MTVNKQLLQFGIIGCGRIVQRSHLPALRAIKQVRLVAICDPSHSAIEAISAQYPEVRKYSDVDSFLADASDLDFVVLATPGDSHFTIGEKILRSKRHLLCEKPFTLNEREAQHLYDIAAKEDVIITPIHNYKYKDTVKRALQYKASGALGDIVTINVRFRGGSLFVGSDTWRRQERKHRIVLFDFCYHFAYLALMYLGPVCSFRFLDAEVDNMGLKYVVFGTLHENGARGLFELMIDSSHSKSEIEIIGESNSFILEFYPDGFHILPRRDNPMRRSCAELYRMYEFARDRIKGTMPGGIPQCALSHLRLFSAFIKTLQNGAPNPVTKAETMQLISMLSQVAEFAYAQEKIKPSYPVEIPIL
jgi:predicted dehydrogenase